LSLHLRAQKALSIIKHLNPSSDISKFEPGVGTSICKKLEGTSFGASVSGVGVTGLSVDDLGAASKAFCPKVVLPVTPPGLSADNLGAVSRTFCPKVGLPVTPPATTDNPGAASRAFCPGIGSVGVTASPAMKVEFRRTYSLGKKLMTFC
jgi:hypothetical protein